MKYLSMAAAMFLPMAAIAGESLQATDWDYEQLRGTTRVSTVIDSDAASSDGAHVGEVEDVILGPDGDAEFIVIAVDDGLLDRPQEEVPATRRNGRIDEDTFVEVAWTGRTDDGTVHLDITKEAFVEKADARQARRLARRLAIRAPDEGGLFAARDDAEKGGASEGKLNVSELLGMQVNLADEESFGEVDDVLVDTRGEVAGIVVSRGLLGSARAVPFEMNFVNREEKAVELEFSSQDVERLGEFNDAWLEST